MDTNFQPTGEPDLPVEPQAEEIEATPLEAAPPVPEVEAAATEAEPVADLEAAAEEAAAEPEMAGAGGEAPPVPPPAKPKRGLGFWIGVTVLALLAIAVVVALATGLPGRFLGGVDTASGSVPADTPLYMGINLLELNPENFDRVLQPMLEGVPGAEIIDTDDAIDKLDAEMKDQLGLTFTDDIRPWVGQYLGLALSGDLFADPSLGMTGLPPDVEVTIVMEALDKDAADEFLVKFRAALQEKQAYVFAEQEYQGVPIYWSEDNQMALARSQGFVLLANSVEAIQASIDAQSGESLRDSADYKALVRQLPKNRLATFYLGGEEYQKLVSAGGFATGMLGGIGSLASTEALSQIKASAGSLAITDDGLQLDMLSAYDPEKLTDEHRQLLEEAGLSAKTAESLQPETMMMLAGQGMGDSMALNQEYMAATMGMDYEDALQMLNEQLGFNLQTELMDYLDEEFGMGLLPEQVRLLAQPDFPVNLVIFSHISDQAAVAEAVKKLTVKVEEMGMATTLDETGDTVIYTMGDPTTIGDLVSIGVSSERLAISLTKAGVEFVLDPVEPLADHADYKEVWTHFPRGTAPTFYLELANLAKYLMETMPYMAEDTQTVPVVSMLSKMPYLAVGTTPFKNDTSHMVMILFVEGMEEGK